MNGKPVPSQLLVAACGFSHENNDNLSIQTEIIRLDPDFAVIKAAVESNKGKFNGTGTASVQRDFKFWQTRLLSWLKQEL